MNAIAPGWFETDLTASVKTKAFRVRINHGTDTGRWGNPDECAGAAVFWRPEHPILSLALPSALTAVILSGEF